MTATTGDDDNTNANADNTECGADATDSRQQPMDVDNNNSVGGDGSSGSTAAADGQHQPTASDTGLLSTGEAMKNMFRNLYEAASLAKIKQYIQFINARVLTNKTYFFYINDFYHYVCVLTDTAVDQPSMHTSLATELNEFYRRLIAICYEWHCLADDFRDDYRIYNVIQLTIKTMIDRFSAATADVGDNDNVILNRCVPSMLASMLIMMSTLYGLKEAAILAKPMTTNLVGRLRHQRGLAMDTEEWRQLLSYLATIGELWIVIYNIDSADDERLSKLLINFIDLSLERNEFRSHIVGKAIKCLSQEKNKSLDQLVIEFQQQIAGHIIRLIEIDGEFRDLNHILTKTMSLFGISYIPKEFMRHIVAHFVSKGNDMTVKFVREFIKLEDKPFTDILKIYLSDVIRQMFFDRTAYQRTYGQTCQLLKEISKRADYDVEYRVEYSATDYGKTLLIWWSAERQLVVRAIAFIHYYRLKVPESSSATVDMNCFENSPSTLRSALHEYFLPFVHRYESLMQDYSVPKTEKLMATRSFSQLMEFMGPDCVNTYRVKLFSTIQMILSERFLPNKPLIKLSIELMTKFVQMADKYYLSTQLLTISALMLPILHYWPTETSELFTELILKNRFHSSFQSAFKHLYFIPKCNELRDVSEIISDYIMDGNDATDVDLQLRLAISNINHENPKVQEFSLRQLLKLLTSHQSILYKQLFNNNNNNNTYDELAAHEFIGQIVGKLMDCFRTNQPTIIELVGECIGTLGAIDPLRCDLDKPIITREANSDRFLNSNDNKFKVHLITLLYRTLTTATTTADHYAASYSLQEIIKLLTGSGGGESSGGGGGAGGGGDHVVLDGFNLDDLSEDMRHYCEILKKTRYTHSKLMDIEISDEPIFGSQPDLTYRQWLNRWLKTLFHLFIFTHQKDTDGTTQLADILSMSQSQGVSSQRSDLFESELCQALAQNSIKIKILCDCFPTMCRNRPVAQYLLPYAVIAALKNAKPNEKDFICNELRTIVKLLTADDYLFGTEMGHLAAQTVFHIYDHLRNWHKKRLRLHQQVCTQPRQHRFARLKDKEFKGVDHFLQQIVLKDLAVLAFKCKTYSRSLRYLEEYCIESAANNDIPEIVLQSEIPLLQRIYIHLDEPDSVEGLNCKRVGTPTVTERILIHESMGQIQEALVCCAKAVELDPNDFDVQRKYLTISMDSFDQSEMVYTYGTGLSHRRPDWRRKLAPHVIESVWKLGHWSQLPGVCREYDDTTTAATFGAGVGDLFCALLSSKQSNETAANDFETKLSALRRAQVGPLAAAALEISGYVRAHEFVVNLHTLQDIQLMYNNLMAELMHEDVSPIDSLKDKFAATVDVWQQRNHLVRPTIKYLEPILNTQRALLSIMDNWSQSADLRVDIKKQLFQSWLMSTKTARKSGNIQRSYNCLLEMNKIRDSLNISLGDTAVGLSVSALSDADNCETILETAKVCWNKNHKIEAIKYLHNQISQNFSYSLNQCFQKATSNLSDRFTPEELKEIRNNMSFGSLSVTGSSGRVSGGGGTAAAAAAAVGSATNPVDVSVSPSGGGGGDQLSSSLTPHSGAADEAFARLQLLYAKYCDQQQLLNPNSLMIIYKTVTIAAPNSEDSHYSLAQYCHKLYTGYQETRRTGGSAGGFAKSDELSALKCQTVKSSVESLKFGVKHAHKSLPLIFNIWFEFANDYARARTTRNANQMTNLQKLLSKIHSHMLDLLANVPSYIFFIIFAQLCARCLHSEPNIQSVIKTILQRLVGDYPQQTMWLLMRSLNSHNLNRKNCFNDIVQKAVLQRPQQLTKFVNDIKHLSRLMIDMCQKDSSRTRGGGAGGQRAARQSKLSLRSDFRELYNLFDKSSGFSQILLPFRSLVNVTLPKSSTSAAATTTTTTNNSSTADNNQHQPFPAKDVYIDKFDDTIELLHSLQRPKKIAIHGSDGNKYTMLCKPGDDLRKDYCFIEFCNLLNRCFKRDPDSRRRQLSAKIYLVISLTDQCGLIEWIPGLLPFRTIVEGQYRLSREYDAIRESVIRNYPPPASLSKQERVRRFRTDILPKFRPAVFANWFVQQYTDPLSWFAARLAYTRSTAVFSIVGYLLGLGDRHGENIMIDESTGQTVHVDLNCMFNKGEEFQVPETVPFRLTHNMINAMGVTDYEGVYRRACEHTMRVARDNRDAVMNFVTPMRFDHLYEWNRSSGGGGAADSRQQSNEFTLDIAERVVSNIEWRLNGIPDRNDRNLPKGIALSVEGQVDHVIKEATDINNLGVMYVGWTAYL